MTNKKVSIIIPAYNEADTIGEIVKKTKAAYPDFDVTVIDDGSTDDTAVAAKNAGANVFSHPYNKGNGAAVKSGIRISSCDIFVFMDGDGQHDPKDIEKMLKYFPEYDMVVGARTKGNQASLGRAIGNNLYNFLATYVTKFLVKDLTSGFRAVKSEVAYNLLYLLPNTFSYPTTLTLSVLRSGRSLKYIPINTKNRKMGKSSIKIFKDRIRFFLIITKICTLYSPFRIFLPLSFIMFCSGLGYYLYTFIVSGRFTNMSALLFTTSILIFMMGLISEQICQMRYDRSEGER